MKAISVRWRWRLMLILLAVLVPALPLSQAQNVGPFNEREVKRQSNVQDKDDIWVLDFRFKDPRLITVDVPGRGKKVILYLWYQVVNRNPDPLTLIPDFELVTQDKPGVHHDLVLPKVQEAIRRVEDPTGYQDIKNSVTITTTPIPVSKTEAAPRPVTGVATWIMGDGATETRNDINPDANRFSIFISGLSNGWALATGKDDRPIVMRKTLQLNFRRIGDRYYMDSREIRFVPPAEWMYRASTLPAPGGPQPKQPDAAAPAPGAN
jgi:hypothetical protein